MGYEYVRADKAIAATSLYLDSLGDAKICIKNTDSLRSQALDFESLLYEAAEDKSDPDAAYLSEQLRQTMMKLGIPPADQQQAMRELQESLRIAIRTGKVPDQPTYDRLKSTLDLML